MTEKTDEKVTLSVTLGRENGDYVAISTEFKDGKDYPVKNNNKANLQVSHMENVLNHYGKEGWILDNISPDEITLQFHRAKQGLFSKIFGHGKIRHRIRTIYQDKKTALFEIGADTPFGEISSTEDKYVRSIKTAIDYLCHEYGYSLAFQGPEQELEESVIIKLYLYKAE